MFGNELLIALICGGLYMVVPPVAKEAKVVGHYFVKKTVQTAKVISKAVK